MHTGGSFEKRGDIYAEKYDNRGVACNVKKQNKQMYPNHGYPCSVTTRRHKRAKMVYFLMSVGDSKSATVRNKQSATKMMDRTKQQRWGGEASELA